MTFKRVRLELARTKGFAEGSSTHGYEFVVPLNDDGHLDPEEWKAAKDRCSVRRFWEGEDDRVGELHHTRHRTWAFSYAPGEDDDEPIFKFDRHLFAEGEYVSITEHDGVTRPFRVAWIRTPTVLQKKY